VEDFQRFSPGSAPGDITPSGRFFVDSSGIRGVLRVTVVLSPGWHIYATTQKPGGPMRTEIVLAPSDEYRVAGPFEPDMAPTVKKSEVFPVPEEFHEGAVTWTAPIELAQGTDATRLMIRGEVDGQICKEDGMCIPLSNLDTRFTAQYGGVGEGAIPSRDAAPSGYAPVDARVLVQNIAFGLLGGLILNLMPCVLPVIGLKILSFVEQASGSRWRAFQLNLVYAIGIMAVFLVLATLAAGLHLGWGEHFTDTRFKISMIVLVFAMALSFLGVWELPIPGFVGRGKSGELAAQEGVAGAFFKGVFTTILATPCSGPFLGPLFGYTLQQPPYVTYLIMASVGFGMALPYLILGMFPDLMRWMPKPGAWMDTFKELMGFILLGSLVFLFSTVHADYYLATLSLLIGVWFACWWIGRTPLVAGLDRRLVTWVGGMTVAAVVGMVSFHYLVPHDRFIQWQEFSPGALASAQREGRTVVVDFTANWCLTCKLNLVRAIDTRRVGELIADYNIVPLLADWTDRSDEIKLALESLGSRSIPLLAIYPAASPERPIILRDLLSESRVLEAIRQAGPSRVTSSEARTARHSG
jgi:thiol:disulfide interchange protein